MNHTSHTLPNFVRRRWPAAMIAVLAFCLATAASAQDVTSLSQGIALFEQGDDTAALSAFNEAVRSNPHTPLAYYYAAWIRIHRGQYDRALANLELALRDSTGFHDVHSLRALAYRGLGDIENARQAWQTFTTAVGTLDNVDVASPEAIMPPDEYREQLADQQERKREEERLALEQAAQERRQQEEQERLRREQATADSLADIARRVQATADSIARAEARADSIALAQAAADSVAVLQAAASEAAASVEQISPTAESDQSIPEQTAEEPSPSTNDTPEPEAGPEIGLSIDDTPLRDIENQISADIRLIMYWFVGIGALVLIGVGVLLFMSRRRRKKNDETIFSDQVERMLDDIQFEVTENQAISEFERKRQEIAKELSSLKTTPSSAEQTSGPDEPAPVSIPNPDVSRPAFTPPETEQEPEYEPELPPTSAPTHTSLITEEVKTLVSRLAREGTPPAEIARTADLTVTEVNLILAVRERRIRNIADDIHQEEDTNQRDQLIGAIISLQHEGAGPREIARKLDISVSEVELALSIDALKHQSGHDG